MVADNPISVTSMSETPMSEMPDAPLLHWVIRPHRSLDRTGLQWVLGLACLASLVASIPFLVMGAWPVAGFFGLDWLGLYLALRVNAARGRAREEILISRAFLRLRQVDPRGRVAEWHANPRWTRLERQDHPDFGTLALAMVSRGERRRVGEALPGDARADLADALGAALARAR